MCVVCACDLCVGSGVCVSSCVRVVFVWGFCVCVDCVVCVGVWVCVFVVCGGYVCASVWVFVCVFCVFVFCVSDGYV